MQDFHGTLSDATGRPLGAVEGTFYSAPAADGPAAGEFEIAEDGALLQAALEGKPFTLAVDGRSFTIRIESAEAGSAEGTTRAKFATA
jgi:hypothetical protein